MSPRIFAMLLSGALALASAQGRNEWHQPPVKLDAGMTLVETFAPGVTRADVHVRLEACGSGAAAWRLLWNWRDSLNYAWAQVSMGPQRAQDEIYGQRIELSAGTVDGGCRHTLCQSAEGYDGGMFSLKLVYDGYSTRLYAGADEQELVCTAAEMSQSGGQVWLDLSQPMLCQRITAQCESDMAAVASASGDIDGRLASLSATEATIEGVWTYLDRDINRDAADFGGKYTLAILESEPGTYDIYYIEGAQINRPQWQRAALKGRLRATIFANNYDLEWIDANRRVLDDDNNAQLSDDGAILTLRFPLYKSQIRFQRQLIKSR